MDSNDNDFDDEDGNLCESSEVTDPPSERAIIQQSRSTSIHKRNKKTYIDDDHKNSIDKESQNFVERSPKGRFGRVNN